MRRSRRASWLVLGALQLGLVGLGACAGGQDASPAPRDFAVRSEDVPLDMEVAGPAHAEFLFVEGTDDLADEVAWEENRRVLLEDLKTHEDARLLVWAHALDAESEGEAILLASRRADFTREYFAELGVPAEQILVVGHGETPPPEVAVAAGEITLDSGRKADVTVVTDEAVDSLRYWWNVWADPLEDGDDLISPSFTPSADLRPESRYVVTIDLAGLPYLDDEVRRFEVLRKLRRKLEQARKKPALSSIEFEVVVLTDSRSIATPSEVHPEPFRVDLARVRAFARDPLPPSSVSMGELSSDPDADYVFGRLPIEIETTEATGWTSIGLSFWLDGRPFSEISVPVCVRDDDTVDCGPAPSATTTLGASNLLDAVGAGGEGQAPAAAMHIVQLSTGLVGVLHTNRDAAGEDPVDAYRVWEIATNPDTFVESLATLQDQFGRSPAYPLHVGQNLASLLFPQDLRGAASAKQALASFLAEARGEHPFSTDPPNLFVRMILEGVPQPWLYPVGLLNLGESTDDFVGMHARIEMPLPRQSYRPGGRCLGSWVPVLPLAWKDGPLTSGLRGAIEGRFSTSTRGDRSRLRTVTGRAPFDVLPSMQVFHDWLRIGEPSEGVVLSVLSHHDDQLLYFSRERVTIHRTSVQRKFRDPSLAVLSGCSTGALGSAGVVRGLNAAGADAVIASNTGIEGALAGHFLQCLYRAVEAAEPGGAVTVGDAFSTAQRCLHDEFQTAGPAPRSLYGTQVLSFTLSGNPALEICGPEDPG